MSSSINLFLENQKVKKENENLKSLIVKLESKLDLIATILLQIKDNPINTQIVNLQNSNQPTIEKQKEEEKTNYFIPQIDISKSNIKSTEIHKRSRKLDLTDSIQKLQDFDKK